MNAVNGEMRRGLNDAFSRFRDDEDAWVAIVTGAGRAFCAGGDLRDGAGSIGEFAGTFWEKPTVNSFESGWEIFKPVIAAVNGYCLGYGLTLVTWCDFVIASDRAEFGFPEVLLGSPTIVGAIRLPQKVNWQYAMELLMTGERIDAARAKEIGLAGWVVPARVAHGRSPRARGATAEGRAHRGARDEGGRDAVAAADERRRDPLRRDDAHRGHAAPAGGERVGLRLGLAATRPDGWSGRRVEALEQAAEGRDQRRGRPVGRPAPPELEHLRGRLAQVRRGVGRHLGDDPTQRGLPLGGALGSRPRSACSKVSTPSSAPSSRLSSR